MKWEKIDDHTYKCSSCKKLLETSYPPEAWTKCPWCGEKLEAEKTLKNRRKK